MHLHIVNCTFAANIFTSQGNSEKIGLNFPKDDNLATESTTTTCAGVIKGVALDFVLAIQSLQRKPFPCLNLK